MHLTRPIKSLIFGKPLSSLRSSRVNEAQTSREPEPPHVGCYSFADAAGIARLFSKAASRSFLLLLCAFAFSALNGCSLLQPHADPTRFYVLTVPSALPARAAESDSKRWKVGLRPVEVPAYLRSKSLVVRTGTNEIHFADFDRWGEPLDQGISRVMKEILSAAPNVESVALNSHGDDTLDYEVAIQILACEGVRLNNGNSSIRFAATWETRSVGKSATGAKRGAFTADPVAWNGKDFGQLAEGLSKAIVAMSQALAADLPMETEPSSRTTAPPPPTTSAWCAFAWTSFRSGARANGAVAGWPWNSIASSAWTPSSPRTCPSRAPRHRTPNLSARET